MGRKLTNLESKPEFLNFHGSEKNGEILKSRKVKLNTRSGISVERILPNVNVRMIGAWCFLDHFLPSENQEPMRVAAHPHTGLQTVTWLFSGEVHHHDSIGSDQRIQPGELNLMTAGQGISHSEVSSKNVPPLHGVQLWIALPEAERHKKADFLHFSNLPTFEIDGVMFKLLAGELMGRKAETQVYSDLVAAQIDFEKDREIEIPIQKDFEYGLLAINSLITIAGIELSPGELLYQPVGNEKLMIKAQKDSSILLIGGKPFEEQIVMWWNFIGRSHEEIEKMRELWEKDSNFFGEVKDKIGGRIPSPPMPTVKLKPRASRKNLG